MGAFNLVGAEEIDEPMFKDGDGGGGGGIGISFSVVEVENGFFLTIDSGEEGQVGYVFEEVETLKVFISELF